MTTRSSRAITVATSATRRGTRGRSSNTTARAISDADVDCAMSVVGNLPSEMLPYQVLGEWASAYHLVVRLTSTYTPSTSRQPGCGL